MRDLVSSNIGHFKACMALDWLSVARQVTPVPHSRSPDLVVDDNSDMLAVRLRSRAREDHSNNAAMIQVAGSTSYSNTNQLLLLLVLSERKASLPEMRALDHMLEAASLPGPGLR